MGGKNRSAIKTWNWLWLLLMVIEYYVIRFIFAYFSIHYNHYLIPHFSSHKYLFKFLWHGLKQSFPFILSRIAYQRKKCTRVAIIIFSVILIVIVKIYILGWVGFIDHKPNCCPDSDGRKWIEQLSNHLVFEITDLFGYKYKNWIIIRKLGIRNWIYKMW